MALTLFYNATLQHNLTSPFLVPFDNSSFVMMIPLPPDNKLPRPMVTVIEIVFQTVATAASTTTTTTTITIPPFSSIQNHHRPLAPRHLPDPQTPNSSLLSTFFFFLTSCPAVRVLLLVLALKVVVRSILNPAFPPPQTSRRGRRRESGQRDRDRDEDRDKDKHKASADAAPVIERDVDADAEIDAEDKVEGEDEDEDNIDKEGGQDEDKDQDRVDTADCDWTDCDVDTFELSI